MKISFLVRLKSLFVRDKAEFWFNEFTDEEKELRQMNAWQLAAVINESNEHHNNFHKRIVAEYMLNVRLAKIQAKPGYLAVYTAIAGLIVGIVLTLVAVPQPKQISLKCVSECQHCDNEKGDVSPQVPIAIFVPKHFNIPQHNQVKNDSQDYFIP